MSNTKLAADQPKYRRIVLKLSGEALREPGSHETISPSIVTDVAKQIQQVSELGVEIAVVIGGGNIWRGLSASHRGMNRTTADYMGMLATVINGMALQSALEQIGVVTRLQTAIEMANVAEPFILRRAIRVSSVILANLVIGKEVIPEFLQENCTPENLARSLRELLTDSALRRRQVEAFLRIDTIMSTGSVSPSVRAADIVLATMRRSRR